MKNYPTEDQLERIENWPLDDLPALMEYVHSIWSYADAGYWNWTAGETKYSLSTAGWSGNEDIIRALMENTMFWMLCWESSKRGGHYEFEVRGEIKK